MCDIVTSCLYYSMRQEQNGHQRLPKGPADTEWRGGERCEESPALGEDKEEYSCDLCGTITEVHINGGHLRKR